MIKSKYCPFCNILTTHVSAWCDVYTTHDSRVNRLREIRGVDPCLKCAHAHYSSKPCKKGKCKYKDCKDKGSDHAFNLCPEVLNLVKADPPQLSNTADRRKNERNKISKTNSAHDAFISPLIYSQAPRAPRFNVDNTSSDSVSLCSSNSIESVSSVDQVNTMPELI